MNRMSRALWWIVLWAIVLAILTGLAASAQYTKPPTANRPPSPLPTPTPRPTPEPTPSSGFWSYRIIAGHWLSRTEAIAYGAAHLQDVPWEVNLFFYPDPVEPTPTP